jgi:hypothetical protein
MHENIRAVKAVRRLVNFTEKNPPKIHERQPEAITANVSAGILNPAVVVTCTPLEVTAGKCIFKYAARIKGTKAQNV